MDLDFGCSVRYFDRSVDISTALRTGYEISSSVRGRQSAHYDESPVARLFVVLPRYPNTDKTCSLS